MPSEHFRIDDGCDELRSLEPHGRLEAVRLLLDPAGEEYRSALTSATEEAKGVLRELQSAGDGRAVRVARELGGLAFGPLDPSRFTALLDPERRMHPTHLKRLEEAVSILEWDLAEISPIAAIEVRSRTGLRNAVAEALAERGRSYGAVRIAALVRGGSFADARDEHLLGSLPFRDWRSLERELAPPLVVVVQGRDLDTVAGLAEFLDGRQKIVLLVNGPCPPAPLARLMVPGTLVIQGSEPEALERLISFPGPAVAALVPDGAARFVHAPGADPRGSGILEVEEIPQAPPRMWIGGISPKQQVADLRILEDRMRQSESDARSGGANGTSPGSPRASEPPPGGDSDASPTAAPDPAERLAAWLLSRTDLDATTE
jgi:hypothetical protein